MLDTCSKGRSRGTVSHNSYSSTPRIITMRNRSSKEAAPDAKALTVIIRYSLLNDEAQPERSNRLIPITALPEQPRSATQLGQTNTQLNPDLKSIEGEKTH